MDLVKLINDLSWAEKSRDYIGASIIGHPCKRHIWYVRNDATRKPISPALQRTFEIGKRLEAMILDLLHDCGLEVEQPIPENNHLKLHTIDHVLAGHPDAILRMDLNNDAVIEIKTAKNSSFERFKKEGLRLWNETYYAQLQAYMGMGSFRHGVLLAINKDNSELHQEWVSFDEDYYLNLVEKADEISKCEEPPDRINASPIFLTCNRCQFKEICHTGSRDERTSS